MTLKVGRTVIFHTRWMQYYAGPEEDLPPTSFRWPAANGEVGGEISNFQPLDGICYGYVPFHSLTKLSKIDSGVNLGADSIANVLVVFTATTIGDGAKIVGWYENATIYKGQIPRPIGDRSPCKATVDAQRAFLIPANGREFSVPRMQKGYPGISPLAYLTSLNPSFEAKIVDYINGLRSDGIAPVAEARPDRQRIQLIRQNDPQLRAKVEKAAITKVTKFYESLGDTVTSCESEKVGWDLETHSGYRIEVKGRLSESFDADLTPNEYNAFRLAMTDIEASKSYRLAIVSNALEIDSDMCIFRWGGNGWICELSERNLAFVERPGARVGLRDSED
jgi:Domain of unknown function (DUF3883)